MEITVTQSEMQHSKEEGYVGRVHFEVSGHRYPYEITLFSKKGKEWGYSLSFAGEPGSEEEILAVEDYLEEEDDAFDSLVEAAKNSLKS
jgi:hypothetical protein